MNEHVVDIGNMTSSEVFALAEEKKRLEEEQKKREAEEKIAAVRQEMKDLRKSHRRDRNRLKKAQEKEMKRLQKEQEEEEKNLQKRLEDMEQVLGIRTNRTPKKSSGDGAGGMSIRDIEDVMEQGREYRAADVRAALEEAGKPVGENLSQSLNYLKKKGVVVSTQRGVYALADS